MTTSHQAHRISVVTPSFNQASFLDETIRSVLRQEYPNLEYGVMDGASSDGSPEIIRRYQDELAFWVSEPDAGQADAINKGWSLCTGDIFGFLNSDDTYFEGVLTAVDEAFWRHPQAGIVCGQAEWVTAAGKPVMKTAVHANGEEMLKRLRGLPQPAVFVRSSVIERVGMLDPSFHFALDGEFFLRALGNFEAVTLDQPLARMRLHESSKSVGAGTGFAPEILRMAEKIIGNSHQYPRLAIVPDEVRAAAHLVAGQMYYMHGEFTCGLRCLARSYRLSQTYRRELCLQQIPKLAARRVLGYGGYRAASRVLHGIGERRAGERDG